MTVSEAIREYNKIMTDRVFVLHGEKDSFIRKHKIISIFIVILISSIVSMYIEYSFSRSFVNHSIEGVFIQSLIFLVFFTFSKIMIIERPYRKMLLKKIIRSLPDFALYNPFEIKKIIEKYDSGDYPHTLSYLIKTDLSLYSSKKNK